MKWLSVFIISLLLWWGIFNLIGCTRQVHTPNTDKVVAVVNLVDKLPPRQLGNAQTLNGVCKVNILKSNYPHCITHELMHCFEGNWHEGYDTTRYCDYIK